jgi:hypothetical protein
LVCFVIRTVLVRGRGLWCVSLIKNKLSILLINSIHYIAISNSDFKTRRIMKCVIWTNFYNWWETIEPVPFFFHTLYRNCSNRSYLVGDAVSAINNSVLVPDSLVFYDLWPLFAVNYPLTIIIHRGIVAYWWMMLVDVMILKAAS